MVSEKPEKYPNFRIYNNKLYRYSFNLDPLRNDDHWKQLIPKEERKDIIRQAHNNSLAGHTGIQKTWYRISKNYV